MESRDRDKLQRHYSTLLDVMYSSISPHLISTFIISLEMHDEIESRPTERKKMEKLLSILPSRGDRAMRELVSALKPSYGWIAKRLDDKGQGSDIRRNSTNNNGPVQNCPDISIANYVRDVSQILQRNTRVSTHWTFLAHTMALLPTTVMDIKREMSYSGGYEYAIYALLDAWVTKVGSKRATFSKLISFLEREGMQQSGEDVEEYWVSVSYPGRRDRSRSPVGPVITDV